MSSQPRKNEDALFEQLSKNRKKKKRKTLRTVLIILLAVTVALGVWLHNMRRHVEEQFAMMSSKVLSSEVTRGAISTTVTGTGVLEEVGVYTVEIPAGVKITEVAVQADDAVVQGDILAWIDMASVADQMTQVQHQLDALDRQIQDASEEEAATRVNAGVAGRVKRIYAAKGMDVVSCMVEHGALAVLSLDGYMAVDIPTDKLSVGDPVCVTRSEGKVISGTVKAVSGGVATVLVTDNGPACEEEVQVAAEDGTYVGGGRLYIHSPLAITGYAGTVSNVHVKENTGVKSNTRLFSLQQTHYNAHYESLLRQRKEKEAQLMELLRLYRDGAVLAATDGMITAVVYEDTLSEAAGEGAYTSGSQQSDNATAIVTVSPNVSMNITLAVDERDILALQLGQEAEVTVSSVSDEKYAGVVTQIRTAPQENDLMSPYCAQITLDRQTGMLPGMTADVDVKIQGVDDALLIPADALHKTSATYYVFTSYQEETMQYGDRVEVTVGMQNSNFVQIISGLKLGDTVYYTQTQDWFEIWAQGGFTMD